MRKLIFGLLAVVLALGVVLSAGAVAAPPGGGKGKNRPPAPPVRLGVQVAALTPELAEKLGVQYQEGVAVLGVFPDSPADTAGLKRGDIITAINGSPVKAPGDLTKALKEAGDSVTLSVVGKGEVQVSLSDGLWPPRPTPRPMPQAGQGQWGRGFPGPWRGHWGLGLLQPELEGIPVEERFSHYMGADVRITDKDGSTHTLEFIPGTLKAVSGDQLTLLTNEGGQLTFTITSEVKGYQLLERLKEGDKLVVATVDGSVRAIFSPHLTGKPGPRPGVMRGGNGTRS